MVQLKTEMRTQKMELEARAQAAEDGRRLVTEQLSELTMKQQRALAKQVASTYLLGHFQPRRTKTNMGVDRLGVPEYGQ